MCGILVSVAVIDSPTATNACTDLFPWIAARGPDSLQTRQLQIPLEGSSQLLEVLFTSSVLSLRGEKVTQQPLVSAAGDVLCWNGEIWKGLEITDEENDGLRLLEALSSTQSIWKVMEKIEGPWAMVYLSLKDKMLWFGRDCLGRRSLLQKTDFRTLSLSSVGVNMNEWQEVSVDGLWRLDLLQWAATTERVWHSETDLT